MIRFISKSLIFHGIDSSSDMIIGRAVRSYLAEQILNLHRRIEMHTEVSVHQMSSVLCHHDADCTKKYVCSM